MNNNNDHIKSHATILIADKVRKFEAEGIKIAKLQTGETCFYTHEYIVEEAVKALKNGFTHYSSSHGIPELRIEISKL
jgi:aspartate aminotransferase